MQQGDSHTGQLAAPTPVNKFSFCACEKSWVQGMFEAGRPVGIHQFVDDITFVGFGMLGGSRMLLVGKEQVRNDGKICRREPTWRSPSDTSRHGRTDSCRHELKLLERASTE